MQLKKILRKEKREDGAVMLSATEWQRLEALERFSPSETMLFGKKVLVPDNSSFLGSLKELFNDEIYKFNSKNEAPVIIDCGANIGLSAIYFKRRFPGASITTFEPDPVLFEAMKRNLASFGFNDVQCRNEAISDMDGEVIFYAEGGHSGMITDGAEGINNIPVKATRLKDVLEQYSHIDFLKIDIEGHEHKVLPDIANSLQNVDHLFLEYHSFLGQEQGLAQILQVISAAGFRYYLREAFPKPDPFITREIFLDMDLLVNIFCYRP